MNIQYPDETLYHILCVSTNNGKIIHQLISKQYNNKFEENYKTIDVIYNIRYNNYEVITTVGLLKPPRIEFVSKAKEITVNELQCIELAAIMSAIDENVYDKKINVDLSNCTTYNEAETLLEQMFKNDPHMKWEL